MVVLAGLAGGFCYVGCAILVSAKSSSQWRVVLASACFITAMNCVAWAVHG